MEFCFGLLQTQGSKTSASWIRLPFLCSLLCMWTSVECWSYYYSNDTMDWNNARNWCQQHYTDMVAIQNREEIEHLNNWLPFKPKYYWIGIRKIDGAWTWVGTKKTLTEEATNWAENEPNNGKGGKSSVNENCVEMYIKRNVQSGKWNDERCNKKKTALCYTAACQNDSCKYGECVETINSHRCACFDGFYGERCEHVVQCNKEEVTIPNNGSINCTHTYGDFFYDSVCQYFCEEGYQLSMSRPLTCTASKEWSDQPPTCDLVQCLPLSAPTGGSIKCSDPLGPSSYQSTCMFTCNEGYVLVGSNTLQCDASGNWNSSQPSCVAITCEMPEEKAHLTSECSQSLINMVPSFSCNFQCEAGFKLQGAHSIQCTQGEQWSEAVPACKALECPAPESPTSIQISCNSTSPLSSPHPLGTICSFSCAEGFELQGAHSIQCTQGEQWSEAVPACKALECPAPEIPTSVQISCSSSLSPPASTHPLGTICSFSCAEGLELQGTLSMKCVNPGQWTDVPPTCTAVKCPSLEAPENGHINCLNYEYNSQCSFTCNQDYSLVGQKLLTCDRHGNWTGEKPTCEVSTSPTAAIASSVTTGGAATLSGLAFWILRKLKRKASKIELNSNSDIEAPLQVYKNSIDSLI